MSNGHGILTDAIRAFNAAAYISAGVACRAAVESSGYHFLSRTRTGGGGHAFSPPTTLSGEVSPVSYEEVLKALRVRHVLNPELFAKAEKIKTDGDFLAHLTARWDADLHRIVRGRKSRADTVKNELGGFSPWRDPDEVLADLHAAGEIMFALTKAGAEGQGGRASR